MLIGQGRAGKTSLKKSLLGLPFDPEEESTEGIKIEPSKFEIDIDQVKNWKRTDDLIASDLAMMVARELKENKDKKRGDEKKVDKEDEVKEEGKLIVNLDQVKLSRRN